MSRPMTAFAALLFIAASVLGTLLLASGNPAQAEEPEGDLMPAVIGGLIIEPETGAPVVLLMNEERTRYMPIFIGEAEANAIFRYHRNLQTPRPLTHDLAVNMVEAMGGKISRIAITRLERGTYFAEIEITRNEEVLAVDARPSDSMAIALKMNVPVLVARSVFDEASQAVDEELDIQPPARRVPMPEDAI